LLCVDGNSSLLREGELGTNSELVAVNIVRRFVSDGHSFSLIDGSCKRAYALVAINATGVPFKNGKAALVVVDNDVASDIRDLELPAGDARPCFALIGDDTVLPYLNSPVFVRFVDEISGEIEALADGCTKARLVLIVSKIFPLSKTSFARPEQCSSLLCGICLRYLPLPLFKLETASLLCGAPLFFSFSFPFRVSA
jgi:hypothetical protein